jgi:predicted GNAT family acetyltransferase
MTFSRASDQLIIIDHTDVPEALRGRKLGNLLLEHAIADMRGKGGKIFPLCPFAASQFRNHPEYRDVLST